MAVAAAHIAVLLPICLVADQQILLVGGADQVLKRHLVEFGWVGRSVFQIALQGFVADFIGKFKTLNQAVADLRVADILLVTLPAFV